MQFTPLAGRTVEINWSYLPKASQDFVINYGLKQLLADSHVAGKTPEEKSGLLDKKLDKLRNGTLSVRESSGREGDPVARELTKLATIAVHKHITEKLGHKVKDVSKEDMATLMTKARANPARQALAKANVEAEAAIEL